MKNLIGSVIGTWLFFFWILWIFTSRDFVHSMAWPAEVFGVMRANLK